MNCAHRAPRAPARRASDLLSPRAMQALSPQRLVSRRELARRAGCTLKALRHYEARGLIPSETVGGRRKYGDASFARLRLVMAMREIGFSTEEIGALLRAAGNGTAVEPTSAEQIAQALELATRRVSDQIERYQRIREELVRAREAIFTCARCEHASPEHCARCRDEHRLPTMARALLFAS